MIENQELLAVWWLNQIHCESINESNLPAGYLRDEFNSRYGRPGRGRIWVPEDIRCREVQLPPNVLSDYIDFGGIVIRKEDVEKVRPLGGILADTHGNLI